jgi:hypothetical protein
MCLGFEYPGRAIRTRINASGDARSMVLLEAYGMTWRTTLGVLGRPARLLQRLRRS